MPRVTLHQTKTIVTHDNVHATGVTRKAAAGDDSVTTIRGCKAQHARCYAATVFYAHTLHARSNPRTARNKMERITFSWMAVKSPEKEGFGLWSGVGR